MLLKRSSWIIKKYEVTCNMKYSVIIPCYNEEKNLQNLVNALLHVCKKRDLEFVLVENGSLDKSKDFFKKNIEGKYEKIRIIYVDINRGYGYGLLQGIKAATGDYIGWIHADLQVDPEMLNDYFNQIEDLERKCENKIFLKAKRSNRHMIEYFFSYGMGIYESIVFGKRMREVMATPVLFSCELIKNHMEDIPYDFAIDIYVYALAIKEGYCVKHIPVRMRDRVAGDSSWNTGVISRIKQSKKMMDASINLKREHF